MTGAVGSRESPVPRRGARVLVVDADNRLLLVRGSDPARPGSRYWYTVGGGLLDGETEAEGARRELWEETGLLVAPAELEPLFDDVTDFPYDGLWYRQRQTFFLLRVATHTVPADWRPATDEHVIEEHRWWSLDELATTEEAVYPPDLALRLRGILGA